MDRSSAPYFEALCAYADVKRAVLYTPGRYPPGIPVVAPGERLTPALVAHLSAQVAAGGRIVGRQHPELDRIQVVCE